MSSTDLNAWTDNTVGLIRSFADDGAASLVSHEAGVVRFRLHKGDRVFPGYYVLRCCHTTEGSRTGYRELQAVLSHVNATRSVVLDRFCPSLTDPGFTNGHIARTLDILMDAQFGAAR